MLLENIEKGRDKMNYTANRMLLMLLEAITKKQQLRYEKNRTD